ncbi:MAG: VOC family protein [Defluviitaleaceae bacterium]|nr:VOC family protein [Defluviitaleaceae bacterium]
MAGVLGTNVLTQVAVIVRDIEATKAKYAEFFGIEPPPTVNAGEFAVTQTEYNGNPAPNAKCKMAFFSVGGNVSLELIEPNGEKSTWQDFLDEKGEGLHHIAFNVKNTNEKIAAAEQFGMKLTQRGKYGDASGEYAYLDATADLKCFIELLEGYST